MHNENLVKMLVTHEGIKLNPYRCTAGKLTIGVGRNIEDGGITEKEAMYLLENDIARVLGELRDHLPFWEELTIPRKEALADMCFNLGLSRFLGFKRMLGALERRDYIAAASEMLDSRWSRQVKQRAQALAQMVRRG